MLYYHSYYCYLLLQERHAASIAELQEQLRAKKDASRELMTELQRDKDASKELMVLNFHPIYQDKSTNTDAEAAG